MRAIRGSAAKFIILQLVATVLVASLALAGSLAIYIQGPLTVTLLDSGKDKSFTLNFDTSGDTRLEPSVFTLLNPSRLVVDLEGFPVKSAQVVPVKHDRFGGLRVGVHPSKMRLVLDIVGDALPAYTVSGSNKHAEVKLSFDESTASRATAELTGKVTPSDEDVLPAPGAATKPEESIDEFLKGEAKPGGPSVPMVIGSDGNPPTAPASKKAITQGAVKPSERLLPSPGAAETIPDSQVDAFLAGEDEDTEGFEMPTQVASAEPDQRAAKSIEDEILEPLDPEIRDPEPVEPNVDTEPEQTLVPDEPPVPTRPERREPIADTPEPPSDEPQLARNTDSGILDLPIDEPDAGVALVKDVLFDTVGEAQTFAVRIGVKNLDKYQLTIKKSNIWELELENARLSGASLTYPIFPPDTFQGFEGAVAVQRGKNVVIKLFVEDGTKLTPFRSGDQLWVKLADS